MPPNQMEMGLLGMDLMAKAVAMSHLHPRKIGLHFCILHCCDHVGILMQAHRRPCYANELDVSVS